jgi:membrane associated rhomboid family serine protease
VVIPLFDDNPGTSKPYVTVAIMIVCTVVYVFQHLLLSRTDAIDFAYTFGAVPAHLMNAHTAPIPPLLTVLTSMFVHGGFWHLAGNMLYLWIFGNNVEDATGHVRFLLFYVSCGVAAVAAQVLPNMASAVPMVGASGAISGVLGAYMLLFPRARVLLGLPLGLLIVELGRYPAIWVLAAWFLMQLLMGAFAAAPQATGGIAFGAHVGGFVAGCLLIAVFKRRDVPLWRRY